MTRVPDLESGAFSVCSTKKIFKYTLYAVGKAIEDNPAVRISSVKNGHDVASHAYTWIDYAHTTAEKKKAYIKKKSRQLQRYVVSLKRGGIMDGCQTDLRLYFRKFTERWIFLSFGIGFVFR
jgi:hypothetical protein